MEELSGVPSMRTLSLGDFRTDVYKHHGSEFEAEDEDQSWLAFAFNIASGFRAFLSSSEENETQAKCTSDRKSADTNESKYLHRQRQRYPYVYSTFRNQLNDIPEGAAHHSFPSEEEMKKSSAHDEKLMDVGNSRASTPKNSNGKRHRSNSGKNSNANDETHHNEAQQTLTIQTLRQLHLYWHDSLKASDSKHDIIAKLFHPVDNCSVSIRSAHLVDPNFIHSSKLLLKQPLRRCNSFPSLNCQHEPLTQPREGRTTPEIPMINWHDNKNGDEKDIEYDSKFDSKQLDDASSTVSANTDRKSEDTPHESNNMQSAIDWSLAQGPSSFCPSLSRQSSDQTANMYQKDSRDVCAPKKMSPHFKMTTIHQRTSNCISVGQSQEHSLLLDTNAMKTKASDETTIASGKSSASFVDVIDNTNNNKKLVHGDTLAHPHVGDTETVYDDRVSESSYASSNVSWCMVGNK